MATKKVESNLSLDNPWDSDSVWADLAAEIERAALLTADFCVQKGGFFVSEHITYATLSGGLNVPVPRAGAPVLGRGDEPRRRWAGARGATNVLKVGSDENGRRHFSGNGQEDYLVASGRNTGNLRLGHASPIGPLQEVWL